MKKGKTDISLFSYFLREQWIKKKEEEIQIFVFVLKFTDKIKIYFNIFGIKPISIFLIKLSNENHINCNLLSQDIFHFQYILKCLIVLKTFVENSQYY